MGENNTGLQLSDHQEQTAIPRRLYKGQCGRCCKIITESKLYKAKIFFTIKGKSCSAMVFRNISNKPCDLRKDKIERKYVRGIQSLPVPRSRSTIPLVSCTISAPITPRVPAIDKRNAVFSFLFPW